MGTVLGKDPGLGLQFSQHLGWDYGHISGHASLDGVCSLHNTFSQDHGVNHPGRAEALDDLTQTSLGVPHLRQTSDRISRFCGHVQNLLTLKITPQARACHWDGTDFR